MSSILHIIKGLLAGFLGIFIGIFLFFSIGQLIFKNFYKPYVVLSGSMEPSVKTGSVVIVKPADSYFIGNIITFAPNGNTKDLVTHRIINIEAENGEVTYLTKGDANDDPDTWNIKREFIMGKSQLVIPYAGYVVDFAKKPQGFILFVIIPATIIVYEELRSITHEILGNRKRLRYKDIKILSEKKSPNISVSKYPNILVLLPIFGVVFVISFAVTKSFFLDKESNVSNVLGAGTWGPTPTPIEQPIAVEPTPTPTASP